MKHINILSWRQLLLPNTDSVHSAGSGGDTSGSVQVCSEQVLVV